MHLKLASQIKRKFQPNIFEQIKVLIFLFCSVLFYSIISYLFQHLLWYDSLSHPGSSHWNNHIGVDVVLPPLLTQSLGQAHQTKLGRAVVSLAKVTVQSCHWTGEDDSSIVLLPQVGPGCLNLSKLLGRQMENVYMYLHRYMYLCSKCVKWPFFSTPWDKEHYFVVLFALLSSFLVRKGYVLVPSCHNSWHSDSCVDCWLKQKWCEKGLSF